MDKRPVLYNLIANLGVSISNRKGLRCIPSCSFCKDHNTNCLVCQFGKVFGKCNDWIPTSHWRRMKFLCNRIEDKIGGYF